jgi:NADPH:quinone reductase-like Zn-dependent oxidoreductase
MPIEARALRLNEKAADINAVAPSIETLRLAPAEGEILVEIKAAAINPSDAKAAFGMMPHAVWPRTAGRDWCGVVREGPASMIGKEYFGSSGHLGITKDGTHATHLVVEASAAVEKPANLASEEAAGLGVPFVTATEGFRRSGMPKAGDNVLIMGLNGKVGQAAAQIAAWKGARVFGVVRREEPYVGHACSKVEVINSAAVNVAEKLREMTNGKGADIVYNTVGDPYYDAGTKSLAVGGRQIFISAIKRIVEFDIFAFYRGRHTYVGADSLSLSSPACGDILRELLPGLASGHLKPFPIAPHAIYPLERAKEAYVAVVGSARDRLVFKP